jgi:putative redox protein
MIKKAKAVHVKGVTFMARAEETNHWVVMDGPEEFGGSNAGSRAKELILFALAGCTGADVASLLTKMRIPFTRFEINIEAEMAEEHPKVYTKIELIYRFWGEDLDTAKIERAIELSETKYCPASAMLRKSVELSNRYEINP